MDFTKIMSNKSDDELVDIVYIQAFNYTEEALLAAENELKNRMNEGLKSTIKETIEKNFNDLSDKSDSEILKYMYNLHRVKQKGLKEVKHILKMGNLRSERINLIFTDFELNVNRQNTVNKSNKKIIGAVMFFGGIVFTILSLSYATENGGSFYIAGGAMIWGFLYMFEFI